MFTRTPFVSIALFFLAGILLSALVPTGLVSFVQLLSMAGFAAAAAFWFFVKNKKKPFATCLTLFLLLTGAACMTGSEEKLDSQSGAGKASGYVATIQSLPEKRKNSLRVEATVTRLHFGDKWRISDCKVLLSFPIGMSEIPQPGDEIVVRSRLDKPYAVANPGQFDYQRYLHNKGILYTDRLSESSFVILPTDKKSLDIFIAATQVSAWADRIFRSQIKDDRAYGLVKAMLLGRREDLDAEQVQDYTVSGAVHILSVSGMHVAIIFLVLTTALGWVKKVRFGRVLYLSIVLMFLAFYALITGLPPSVQRATIMCVVFAVAEVFRRKNEPMNSLAISALLILLFDPHAAYDVGFQLSYLAMTGIFLFYKPIESLYSFENKIGRFVWQITALSFAAQLATFPLSLYYFHQFPVYFWLVNPFVIGFTNILLPAALVLLLCAALPFSFLTMLAQQVVVYSAYLANVSVALPEKLPGFQIDKLNLQMPEVFGLYILLIMIWISIHRRDYGYLKPAFVAVPLLAAYSISMSLYTYVTPARVVHRIPGHAVVSYKYGNRLYVASDCDFPSDSAAYQFYLKNYEISQEIDQTIFISAR